MTATGTPACFAIPYIILDTDSSTTLNFTQRLGTRFGAPNEVVSFPQGNSTTPKKEIQIGPST
jgi:hypothetical protein